MKTNKINVGKAGLLVVLCMLVAGVLFTGCGKNDDSGDMSNPNLFKPSDFEVIINKKEADGGYYEVRYEVKNKRAIPFDPTVNGYYEIRFKIKTTDGSEYQSEDGISSISANGSVATNVLIYYPEGKTINESTFSYEIFLDK